jgi:hypothetical protein
LKKFLAKKNTFGLFLFPVLLGLAACSSPNPLQQGILVVGIEGNPTDLDPRTATDAYSNRIDSLVYNVLIRLGPKAEILPDLAQGYVDRHGSQAIIGKARQTIHEIRGDRTCPRDIAAVSGVPPHPPTERRRLCGNRRACERPPLPRRLRWTPKTGPQVKMDFRRSAGEEKADYESKTQTA